MGIFFLPQYVIKQYQKLQFNTTVAKKNLEQTTAIGVFLSLDKTQKLLHSDTIDLNPIYSNAGESPREIMSKNYQNLFFLANSSGRDIIVRELGYVVIDGPDGKNALKKFFGSNFLTVPLKKGTMKRQEYPKRPSPLMTLGESINGAPWGVKKYQDWQTNLSLFFKERFCNEDLLSMIVFLLRDYDFSAHSSKTVKEAVQSALSEAYTRELTDFFITHSALDELNWTDQELFIEADSPPVIDFGSMAQTVTIEHVSIEWPEIDKFDEANKYGEDVVYAVLAALESGNNVILFGPPGTGKTSLARLISEVCKGEKYHIVTASSDWTTFEVIGGYMPDVRHPDHLIFLPGIMLRALQENSWIIIDEVNRADVDKAFGELFTFLAKKDVVLTQIYQEYDDDGKLVGIPRKIVLKAEKETEYEDNEYVSFVAQDDWRILGTMNTFDKASLYQLSYAFMRRFAFIEVPPPSPLVCSQIIQGKIAEIQNESTDEIKTVWSEFSRLLIRVFASEDIGLHSINKAVGASIPIEIINYLKIRGKYLYKNPKLLILEALSLFLFPQFEAQRQTHDLLVKAISDALELEGEASIDQSLALWTGAAVLR